MPLQHRNLSLMVSAACLICVLIACTPVTNQIPTIALTGTETEFPTATPTPLATIISTQPIPTARPTLTPFPTIKVPPLADLSDLGLPDWQTVQKALLEGAKLSGDPNGRCEWEVLGHDRAARKVYLWAHCEARVYSTEKSGISGAMAVYLKEDGSIDRVYVPQTYGGDEFYQEFPENIRKKFDDDSRTYDLQANLALRELYPELPPQAVVVEGQYPTQPLSTLSVESEKTERWVVYQSALAKAWYGTAEEILCEWDYLGQIGEYVYLKPHCEPLDFQQYKFWMPFCRLKIDDDGSISEVICKEKVEMGNGWGLDPVLFPLEIRQKSWVDSTNSIFMDRIELRRWFQDLPPLIIEYGLELP
ncbi:MAG: hypothetical protein WBI14_09490 [Anaerolineaceae bacterium]